MSKPKAPRITPNEGHIIKATAWDALYAAYQINNETGNSRESVFAKAFLKTMDTLLDQVGEKYSTAETWEAIMPKKFENDELYRCVACATATLKTDWEQVLLVTPDPAKLGQYYICPSCGCIVDVSVMNVMPEPKTYTEEEVEAMAEAEAKKKKDAEIAKKQKSAAGKK